MEVVLIQGEENTGKTTLCKKIEKILKNSNFELERKELREVENNSERDFRAIYVHKECKTRIIINSGADLITIINRFNDFYNNNKRGGYDILITAIRPTGTIINKHDVYNGIKDVYKSDFKGKEYVIDLDDERNKEENVDLDFCEFIKKVLEERGGEILKKIKTKLKCEIEININCPQSKK